MRLSLQASKGTWRISEMTEVHLELLRHATSDASASESAAGRARMLPSPLSQEEAVLQPDFLEDWQEFVTSEMEEKFTADVSTFQRDLLTVEARQSAVEEDAVPRVLYRLTLPIAHGFDWFSTLNQARIMMDLHYKFHDENDEFVPLPEPEVLGDLDPDERLAAYLRYDFYCLIQEWIVRNIMDAG